MSTCGAGAPGAYAQSWAEHWFDNVTYTSPGSFEDQARGYVTAGGFSGRVDVHHDYLTSVTLPKVRAGCGGIDMFLGGMSFLDRSEERRGGEGVSGRVDLGGCRTITKKNK